MRQRWLRDGGAAALVADGPGAEGVDVVQLCENFSAQGVMSLIHHGLCTCENVAEFIRFETLIAPTGKLPINTAGGKLAHGFIHGFGTAIEAVRVLRGESANPIPRTRRSAC